MARNLPRTWAWSQPSWWVVAVAGVLTVFFMVAIIREIVRSTTVRRQVQRLQTELATETRHQTELRDLIGYLSSPTFQEREARLKLGLKKSGERVIVIPVEVTSNTNGGQAGSTTGAASASSPPTRWWQYFFGTDPTTSSTQSS